jgi:hypothetical protein
VWWYIVGDEERKKHGQRGLLNDGRNRGEEIGESEE